MSLIRRIFGGVAPGPGPVPLPVSRTEPPVTAVATLEPSGTAEPRAWLSELGWSAPSRVKGLPRVSALVAERHATVSAVCNVIAGDIAKVPLKIWRKHPDGREERIRGHRLAYLLNVEASPGVPASVLRYALAYAFALRGNAFAYAPRGGGGEVELIETVLEEGVGRLRNGRARFYDFEDGAGMRRRVSSRLMVHLRHMSRDGWTGRSPIEVAAESMGLALAGQELAGRILTGSTMRAVIKMEDVYDDDEAWRRNARRVRNAIVDPEANGFPILGAQDAVEVLDLKAGDQELLASRKMDREQICAIYRVPPAKVGILDGGLKANVEQAAIDYLTDCLMYWAGMVETQMALALLTDAEREAGMVLRHDFGALLRPTTKERYEALKSAVGGPFMTPNEARQKEGLAPQADGDRLNPAANMTRKDGAPDRTSKEGGGA